MNESKRCGCDEYESLNRRQFLSRSITSAAALASAPAWLPRVSFAQSENSARDVMVSVFLRGGGDGLTLCVPHGDNAYYTARPSLAIPQPDSSSPNAATDLDGFFGLAPAMAPLAPAFNAGDLLIVHATGSQDTTRSHFDAMKFMEVGKPRDPSLATGWLGRHLLTTAPVDPSALMRAIGISPGLQQTLVGAPLALPVPDPSAFTIFGDNGSADERVAALAAMYQSTEEPLVTSAQNTASVVALLDAIDFDGYVPAGGAQYPETGFGMALKSTAALIKADLGLEAVALDKGGWDTHNAQDPIGGQMFGLMSDLAAGLEAFHLDLIANGNRNVVLTCKSEFGRTVRQNASLGSDHGHGNVMFAMGQRIAGGSVLANWPGLEDGELYEGQDLDVTIDYRDILAEIVQSLLDNNDLSFVFPDFTPTFRGVTT